MERISEFVPVFVTHVPKEMIPGKLYVSEEDGWAAHICACGCGFPVWMKLGEERWWILKDAEGKVILRPSTLSLDLPCGSNYCITHNRVEWLSEEEARQCDITRPMSDSCKETCS